MATTTTTTRLVARATIPDRDSYLDGVTGAEDDYGKVDLIRVTTTIRRANGDIGRVLSKETHSEHVATLDAEAAATLSGSLAHAVVKSLQVRPGMRLR